MGNAPVVAAAAAVPLTDSNPKSPSTTAEDQGGQIITPAPLKVVSPTHSGTQSPILTSTIDPIITITTTTNNNNLSSSVNPNPTSPNPTSVSIDEPSSEATTKEYVEGDRVEVLYEANGEFYPAVVTMRIDAAYTGNNTIDDVEESSTNNINSIPQQQLNLIY